MPKSIAEHLRECITAAQYKNYDAALDAVNAALLAAQNTKADRVDILDHRVAVYLKIGSLDLAMKDAKAMVRHDRTEARGYLRCGQIQRLLGNSTTARDWYRQGTIHVPSSHRSFRSIEKQLRKVEDQLVRELVLTKASDPMLTLPLETVQLILSFLSYKQILIMTGVSKSWRKLLCGLSPIIDTIHYHNPQKSITNFMLRATLRKLKVPKSITATRMSKEAEAELIQKLGRWQNYATLNHLDLQLNTISPADLPFLKYDLKSLVLGPCIERILRINAPSLPLDTVYEILRSCPKLESASFNNIVYDRTKVGISNGTSCPTLRTLLLRAVPLETGLISIRFLGGSPNLEELSCWNISLSPDPAEPVDGTARLIDLRSMQNLEILHLVRGRLACQLYLPSSIRNLRLANVEQGRLRGQLSSQPPTRLTSLQSLDLRLTSEWPDFVGPVAMPHNESLITDLCLSVDTSLAPRALEFLSLGCFRKLRRIRLHCEMIDDSHVSMFVKQYPDLETLHLDRAGITGVFVTDLLKAPSSKLRKVLLEDCSKVARDVIPWAAARGVSVTIKKLQSWEGLHMVREFV